MNIDTREITLEPADNARLLALCGPFDDNIKQLERRLGIEINRRDNHFKLTGRALCVHAAADIPAQPVCRHSANARSDSGY
ncbi:phosphate starvation-inducible ATPase PhoH with RNA binding motif [Klebsiella pneumoniae]|uniref:Phosphate starvation-inducible ATPase PhoH with RNA binding motif n=1 Tax=Klebsiella pneumoniae TaxID=573 RepID=A0A378AI63_KLEPN|nr:phosphate starvation-inducible ATPase PhoH with RNA binding motif [Klebsiella pneumoniae]